MRAGKELLAASLGLIPNATSADGLEK